LRTAFQSVEATLPDKQAIELRYFREYGRLLNLKNPLRMSEKIQWRKLYQRDPRFVVFADKIAVKLEVAKLIGEQHVIPNLWTGDDPSDIPWDAMTTPFVIKANHSFGRHVFVRDKSNIDCRAIACVLQEQLSYSHDVRGREWCYGEIHRKLLVERMIEAQQGVIPEDYKFFVYHGRVHFTQVDRDRFAQHRRSFFDRAWKMQPTLLLVPHISGAVPRPPHYQQMIELAERIGSQFDFVRVDLYDTSRGIFFGETTFYPGSGFAKLEPDEQDLAFGAPWKLPPRG
jgi:hypothetical protein